MLWCASGSRVCACPCGCPTGDPAALQEKPLTVSMTARSQLLLKEAFMSRECVNTTFGLVVVAHCADVVMRSAP